MIPKRAAFVLSQATPDGQYEAVAESHGFDASDIKDNAQSLSDCTALGVRKAALEWASQQAASGPDSPRLTQLGGGGARLGGGGARLGDGVARLGGGARLGGSEERKLQRRSLAR